MNAEEFLLMAGSCLQTVECMCNNLSHTVALCKFTCKSESAEAGTLQHPL